MDKKFVLHFSKTSLAGAPIRIVHALNRYTDYSARLVNFMPSALDNEVPIYEEDLNWQLEQDKKITHELVKKADIIHFHHFMELEFYNPFLINFYKETKPGCKFLRHFHSEKNYISKNDLDFIKYFPDDKLPRVVIPHCPERTFLECEIVPNVIPIHEPYCMPLETNNEKPVVAYSVSNRISYKKERWTTKGYPEVIEKLYDLRDKLGFELVEIVRKNFYEAMDIKQKADIVIGDIVAGSYHLTELEGLSLGKPTLTYLDGRSVMTFMNTFKTKEVPFVNVNIDNLEYALKDLIENKNLRENIGKFSREWVEKYYDDSILIKSFTDVYDRLLKDEPIKRAGYSVYPDVKEYLYNRVYDYNWLRISETE